MNALSFYLKREFFMVLIAHEKLLMTYMQGLHPLIVVLGIYNTYINKMIMISFSDSHLMVKIEL